MLNADNIILDTWTSSPLVSHPDAYNASLACALPIVVRYRYHAQGELFTKTFGITPEGRASFVSFIDSIRAKAIEEEYTTPSGGKSKRWVLVDRGLVDWMSICFVDPAHEKAKQAKRDQALHFKNLWKQGLI